MPFYRYEAFLSYTHADANWVDVLRQNLDACGIRTFHDVQAGIRREDTTEELRAALEASEWMIVVETPASLASDWVLQEVKYFLDFDGLNRRPEQVLRLGLEEVCDLPEMMRDAPEALDARSDDPDTYRAMIAKLCERLGRSCPQQVILPPVRMATVDGGVRKQITDLLARRLESCDPDEPDPIVLNGLCTLLGMKARDVSPFRRPVAQMTANAILVKAAWVHDEHHVMKAALGFLAKGASDAERARIDRLELELDQALENLDQRVVADVKRALGSIYQGIQLLGGRSRLIFGAVQASLQRPVVIVVQRNDELPGGAPPAAGEGQAPRLNRRQEDFALFAQEAGRLSIEEFSRVIGARLSVPPVLYIREHIDGEALSDILRLECEIPLVGAVQLLTILAGALRRLHDERMVHVDLRTSSIFIGSEGDVRVNGFGAVSVGRLEQLLEGEGRLYHEIRGRHRGAPEEKEGLPTASSDQWRFGRIVRQVLACLSEGSKESSEMRELELMCKRLCQEEPAQRFRSMAEVHERLEELLHRVHGAAPTTRRRKAARPSTPRERLVVAFGKTIEEVRRRREDRRRHASAALESVERARLREEGNLERIALAFYTRLFEKDPLIPQIFRDAQKANGDGTAPPESQQLKLREAIRLSLFYARTPAYKSLLLDQLKRLHSDRGIPPGAYVLFLEALLETVEEAAVAVQTERPQIDAWLGSWDRVFSSICRYLMGRRITLEPLREARRLGQCLGDHRGRRCRRRVSRGAFCTQHRRALLARSAELARDASQSNAPPDPPAGG